jgi:type VI secretion system secreted protein Hcp
MKRRFVIGAVLVAVIAIGAGMYAFAAPRAGAAGSRGSSTKMRVAVTGQKQGAFSKTAVPILDISHEIVSPRDPASGLPTGKRQHKPFTITMELGRTTPEFLNAFVNNENLTSVLIGLVRDGRTVAQITLTNASVARYVEHNENVEFDFTYQKITWTWVDGGITAEDSWEAPTT